MLKKSIDEWICASYFAIVVGDCAKKVGKPTKLPTVENVPLADELSHANFADIVKWYNERFVIFHLVFDSPYRLREGYFTNFKQLCKWRKISVYCIRDYGIRFICCTSLKTIYR